MPDVTKGRSRRFRSATMIDVARLAGVSHQTVSRVLNGDPAVTPALLARVREAIRVLGYTRNTAARALASRRSMSIGVVTYGLAQHGPSVALIGIAEAARQRDHATSLVALAEVDRDTVQDAVDHLIALSVDGIVLIAPVTAAIDVVGSLTAAVPLVRYECGPANSATGVSINEALGARLATQHLLDLGHATVSHVSGPPGWLGTEQRIDGWRSALLAAKASVPEPVAGDWSAESGYRAGKRIADDASITAVFVANDQMALGVLHAVHESGRRVPRDVSVVGFDDIPECAFFQPALTTVRLDFAELGRRCVARLMDLIGNVPRPLDPALTPELVVRASVAAPAGHGKPAECLARCVTAPSA
jgi:DNA-binding LacI/PurR family transcriptional regulator